MGRRTIAKLVVGLMATTAASAAGVRTAIASAAGDFTFVGPTALLDTRVGGPVGPTLDPGEQVPLAAGADVLVTALRPSTVGALFVSPCAAPTTDRAVVVFDLGPDVSNFTRVPASGPAQCLTASVPVGVTVEQLGQESSGTTGLSFVPFSGRPIFDGPAPSSATTFLAPVGTIGVTFLVESPSAAGTVALFPCDGPATPALHLAKGTTTAVVVRVSADLHVCLRSLDGAGDGVPVRITATGSFVSGGAHDSLAIPTVHFDGTTYRAPGFVATAPTRLFDTRTPNRMIAAGDTYVLDLSDRAPVDASAVLLNLTATDPGGPGFVTAYPCSDGRPTASNLNYAAGQTVANLVAVGVGADRRICFFTLASTQLVADLAGYYVLGAGDGFVRMAPGRIADTRRTGRLAAQSVLEQDLTGRVDPAATAVTLNVTAATPDGAGYVTVYPCAEGRPTASNLNYVAGQTVPNLVTVKLGADRKVCLFTWAASDLIVDLDGAYAPGAPLGFYDVTPNRMLDTRRPGRLPAAPGGTLPLDLGAGVGAVTMNVTVVRPDAPGYVTVYPCAEGRPTASNLNYEAGQTRANLVTVKLDEGGQVCFYSSAGTDLIADVAGGFSSDPVVVWTPVIA